MRMTLCCCVEARKKPSSALQRVQEWTATAGLTLHPVKTRIVDAQKESFDFLGYRFDRGRKWPREKSRKQFRDTIRAKTRRTRGHSLKVVIEDLNRTLKGWFEYFKHSDKATFRTEDGWVRGRLRSISCANAVAEKAAGVAGTINAGPRPSLQSRVCSLKHAHAIACQSFNEVKPPTGEPDAGDPHVRFGGRGSRTLSLPLSRKSNLW